MMSWYGDSKWKNTNCRIPNQQCKKKPDCTAVRKVLTDTLFFFSEWLITQFELDFRTLQETASHHEKKQNETVPISAQFPSGRNTNEPHSSAAFLFSLVHLLGN
ncbi:unnamed protein product, partial [Ectocarpus sp. 4 AP-2014]